MRFSIDHFSSAAERYSPWADAVPVMDELAKKARLAAVLTTFFGMKVVDTYRASADPSLGLGYGRGRPRPLFRGAAPKVILSCMPRAQLLKIYEANAEEAAANDLGASWAAFRARLAAVRKQSFYRSRGELERGVGAIAVPILNADDEAVAGLALVGTAQAIDAAGDARMHTLLSRVCDDIQARLGCGIGLPRETVAMRKGARRGKVQASKPAVA